MGRITFVVIVDATMTFGADFPPYTSCRDVKSYICDSINSPEGMHYKNGTLFIQTHI
jgi:hypothetical protein